MKMLYASKNIFLLPFAFVVYWILATAAAKAIITTEGIQHALILLKNEHLSNQQHEAAPGNDIRIKFTFEQSEYQLKEYETQLFMNLSKIYGIEPAKFLSSFTDAPIKGFVPNSEGGSTFLMSADEKFLLKSLVSAKSEHTILLKNLLAYAQYMEANEKSFLTKFYGIYSIQSENSDKIFWFIIMPNVLKSQSENDGISAQIDYQFDIKGHHSEERSLNYKKLADIPVEQQTTFKEWEFNGPGNANAHFPEGIVCDERVYNTIAEQLAKDAKFLADTFKVADYSLFVGIHFNNEHEEQEASEKISTGHSSAADQQQIVPMMSNGGIGGCFCRECKLPQRRLVDLAGKRAKVDGRRHGLSIFVGIIDILGYFGARRRFLFVIDVYFKRKIKELERSYLPPKKYLGRFKCFVNSEVFHVENEETRKLYTEKYCRDFNMDDWSRDEKWTRSDEISAFGGHIDRSGKIPRLVLPTKSNEYKKP